MCCFPAAPVLIIVHCWQVIMHKRICVYHLYSRHKRKHKAFLAPACHLVCFPHNHRTQPFASCHKAVLHSINYCLLVYNVLWHEFPGYLSNPFRFFLKLPVKSLFIHIKTIPFQQILCLYSQPPFLYRITNNFSIFTFPDSN